jgi:hypothetical protein
MTNTDFKAKNYLTTFRIGQDGQGNWKAWKEFNGEVQDERYCLDEEHAKRTRTMLVNKFWGYRIS